MKTAARMTAGDRRRSIIRAAETLFIERGFHATTTRDLAKAAGVSEALLFKHFPSKEALYAAIQQSCFKEEGAKILELCSRSNRRPNRSCSSSTTWCRTSSASVATMAKRVSSGSCFAA